MESLCLQSRHTLNLFCTSPSIEMERVDRVVHRGTGPYVDVVSSIPLCHGLNSFVIRFWNGRDTKPTSYTHIRNVLTRPLVRVFIENSLSY